MCQICRRRIAGSKKIAAYRDVQIDAFETGGNGFSAQRDFKESLTAGDPVAGVMKAERCARYRNLFAKDLILALDDGTADRARLFARFFPRKGLLGRPGVFRKQHRPVFIPRAEMRYRNAPEGLPGRIERCQLYPLTFGNPEKVVRKSISIRVKIGQAACDLQNLDDLAAVRSHPGAPLPVVIPERHRSPHRKFKKILQVVNDGGAEFYLPGIHCQRFIHRELHGVGVSHVRRQLRRHRLRPVRPHCELRGPNTQIADGLHRAVRHDHLRRYTLWKQKGCPAFAVRVGTDASQRHLDPVACEVDGRHIRIELDKNDIRECHIILPGDMCLPLGR